MIPGKVGQPGPNLYSFGTHLRNDWCRQPHTIESPPVHRPSWRHAPTNHRPTDPTRRAASQCAAPSPRATSPAPPARAATRPHAERPPRRGQGLFCGVVPKTEPERRKGAAAAGRVVWVDIDRKSTADPPGLEEIERLVDQATG